MQHKQQLFMHITTTDCPQPAHSYTIVHVHVLKHSQKSQELKYTCPRTHKNVKNDPPKHTQSNHGTHSSSLTHHRLLQVQAN
jgi:hypothetical protein